MRRHRLCPAVVLAVAACLLSLIGDAAAASKVTTKAIEPAAGDAGATPGAPANDPAYAAFEDGRYLTAMKEAKVAAARGEPAAHTLIGRMLAEGLGVTRDLKAAAQWYRKAADLGDANAQLALGLLYAKGTGVEKSIDIAGELFEKASAAGLLPAKYNLGLLYTTGTGRPEDPARGAALIAEAAKGGEVQARYDLGQLYMNGVGVPKDDAQAARWTGLAADGGLPEAQVEYGIMLFKGRGVPVDRPRAAWFFTAAAERGNPVAQNRLANLYAFGIVYDRDLVTAAKWHLLARAAGISDMRLDAFMGKLTPEQRQRAEAEAAAWKEGGDQIQ